MRKIRRVDYFHATVKDSVGAGYRLLSELAAEGVNLLAFNAIPHIDVFLENRYTKEEMKMVWETRKIFGDESIQVNPTCVRIPVFYGHSEAVHIETVDKITAEEARALLARGYQRIAFLGGPEGATSTQDRLTGFAEEGYRYSEEQSQPDRPVFLRERS